MTDTEKLDLILTELREIRAMLGTPKEAHQTEWLNLKEAKRLLGPKVCADTFLRFAHRHGIQGKRIHGTGRRYFPRSKIEAVLA